MRRWQGSLLCLALLLLAVVGGTFAIAGLMEKGAVIRQIQLDRNVWVDVYETQLCARMGGELYAFECVNMPEDETPVAFHVYHPADGLFVGSVFGDTVENLGSSNAPPP